MLKVTLHGDVSEVLAFQEKLESAFDGFDLGAGRGDTLTNGQVTVTWLFDPDNACNRLLDLRVSSAMAPRRPGRPRSGEGVQKRGAKKRQD